MIADPGKGARMFVDRVKIQLKAGNGGDGCVSFRREKYVPKGGPDGGDGGLGSNVILRADRDEASLISIFYAPHQVAQKGGHGQGSRIRGRNGKDLVVRVPCGTEVHEKATGAQLGDLVEHGKEMIIARGGKGGLGNWHWKSSTHQAPTEHTNGELGEEVELEPVVDVRSMLTDADNQWVQEVNEIMAEILDTRPENRTGSAFTDASVLTPAYGGVPTIILGPGEPTMAHKTDEYCFTKNIDEAQLAYIQIARHWNTR